jgi:hypothetical protein
MANEIFGKEIREARQVEEKRSESMKRKTEKKQGKARRREASQ